MLLLTLLFTLQIYSYAAAAGGFKVCDDCMQYKSCAGAVISASEQTPKSMELFRSAFCGFDFTDDKRKMPKVCCSAFPTVSKLALLPQSCGAIGGKRIIGGNIASLYEFPWMALISYNHNGELSFDCAGSIINSRYILTAAHCVYQKNIAGVRVGEFEIGSATDCQEQYPHTICESYIKDYRVEDKIVHENYIALNRATSDIALLRVNKEIDFSHKNVDPICLPTTDDLKNANIFGETATVAGWGITETNRGSSILRKVNIPILPNSSCTGIYDRLLARGQESRVKNEFCAGELNKDSCGGDSGGPLIIESQYNGVYSYIQYGIVSRGPKKCGSESPGIYTEVTKYMDWILDKINP